MNMLDDRIRDACHRIEELYHETEGKCYVSFSGGKDSTVLLALIKLCEEILTIPPNSIPAVFCNTGIEMQVTVDFVNWVKENYYPNVVIIRPEKSFDWVIKNYGKPVRSKLKSEFLQRYHHSTRTRNVMQNLVIGVSNSGKVATRSKLADRDMHMLHDNFPINASNKCCSIMKKKPMTKYARDTGAKGFMVGIRMGEGGARELNTIHHSDKAKICTSISRGYIKKAVIIDWSEEEVNEFIDKYNVPLSEAYTKYGFTRTGCCACPYARDVSRNLEYLFKYEPNRYKAMMHWLKDVYIAQGVVLPFDKQYEKERHQTWQAIYEPMRQEVLRKYRPESRLIKDGDQLSLFDEETI